MPHATLAGIPLTITGDVAWGLSQGTEPAELTLRVLSSRGDDIYRIAKKTGGAVNFEIGERTYKRVYVLANTGSVSGNYCNLELRDLRYRWKGKLIARAFNKRRVTNQRRRADEANTPLVARTTNPDVDYYQWSLKRNGKPYTLKECLVEILDEIGDKYRIEATVPTLDVEDIDEIMPANEWLDFLLRYAPGLQVFIDYDGTVIVKDTRDLSEVAEVRKVRPRRGQGSIRGGDFANLRPRAIRVFFRQRQDMAFYFDAAAHFQDIQRDEVRGRERRSLIPIIVNPVLNLEVSGRTVADGTPIDEREFYEAIKSLPRPPTPKRASIKNFNEFASRRFYFARYAATRLFADRGGYVSAQWDRIIKRVFSNKRRMFQITKPWLDRFRSYGVDLVGVQDQENLSFSQAKAYCAHTVKRSKYGLGINVDPSQPMRKLGYAVEKDNFLIDGQAAAPADVSIPSGGRGSGLLRVYLRQNFELEEETIIPGVPDKLAVAYDKLPPRANSIPIALSDDETMLRKDWKLAVLINVERGAPNNKGRLHQVTVKPGDVKDLVLGKQSKRKSIGDCTGAVWDVYIQPTPMTMARWAWSDSLADEIENSFFDGSPMPKELLVNPEDIEQIARAAAARIYSSLLDRPTGFAEFSQQTGPAPRPVGSISNVNHAMSSDGAVFGALVLQRELALQDINQFLSRSLVRRLEGMVEP